MTPLKINNNFLSKIGIGSYRNFGEKLDIRKSQEIIFGFIDQGVNLIDSSVNYADGECEKIIGDILKKNKLRKNLFIASKIFFSTHNNIEDGLSRKNIEFSLDKIKKNYKTDFIDCVQCHRYDPKVNLHELVETFEEQIKKGDIKYWGTTNWPYSKIIKVLNICKIKNNFIFNQVPLNIFYKKNIQSLKLLKKKNFINIVYGLLSKGLLTNNFALNKKKFKIDENINYSKKNIIKTKKIFNICKKYGYSLEEFIYALIINKKYVDITLCGISSIRQFKNFDLKKILNKEIFKNKLNEMKKYEEIKNIL